MKLVDLLIRDACVIDMQARTKKEALRELSEALAPTVVGLSSSELLDLLMEREKLGTTALGDGIAIPHARLDGLEQILVTFGRSRVGIDFEAIDGQVTYLFFLLVAPKAEGSAHLLTLARLSRVLGNADVRGRLIDAEATDDVIRGIEEEESKL